MTRGELIDDVASRSGLSREEAERAVDALVETISETLSRGEEVDIAGFGRFSPSEPREAPQMPPAPPPAPTFSPDPEAEQLDSLPGTGETDF